MTLHIREMIELEHCINKTSSSDTLFIASGIFMTSNDQKLLDEKNVNIVEVPEYYFSEELKEIGEI